MRLVRYTVVFLCALVVGGTFVIAGVLKSLDVDGFAHDIALHGIIGPGPAWIAARLLVPFEIVTGVAAILGYRRRLALMLLLASLVLFIGATGYAWYTGHTEGCGCFGRYAARTPLAVIVEDLLLAGAAGIGLLLIPRASRRARAAVAEPGMAGSREGGWPPAAEDARLPISPVEGFSAESARSGPVASGPAARWRALVVGAAGLAATGMAFVSPYLPIDNLVTALHPGTTIADLGLDRITGNLGEGERLLVVLVLDEPRTQKSVPALNALTTAPGVPTITGLYSGTEEKRGEFFWSYAPAFELQDVPAPDFRRLYRRAPRTFRVHNGAVLQVWDGIPDVEEVVR